LLQIAFILHYPHLALHESESNDIQSSWQVEHEEV
jgi:hypothetical protein